MSRAPLHALIWSKEQRLYELHTQDRLEQRFQPTDEATWQSWLREVTSFAFHSPAGSLNVYLERRPRGGAYWYAYHTSQGRTRKRYLGRTETLSLAHLEETALSLWREQQPPQAFDRGMLVLSGRLAPPRLLLRGRHRHAPPCRLSPSPGVSRRSCACWPTGLEPGHRTHARDFPGHRQKTRQQPARQVRSEQSHASD